jgi:hypothetical protein
MSRTAYVNVDIIFLKLRTRMWLIGRSTSGMDPIVLSLIPLAILPSSLSQRRMAQHPADTSRHGRNNEARNHPARKTIFVYNDRSLVGDKESGRDLLLLFLLGSQELAYFTTESSEAIAKKNSLSQV